MNYFQAFNVASSKLLLVKYCFCGFCKAKIHHFKCQSLRCCPGVIDVKTSRSSDKRKLKHLSFGICCEELCVLSTWDGREEHLLCIRGMVERARACVYTGQ